MQMFQEEEEEHLSNVWALAEDDGSAASAITATTAMSIEGISGGPYYPASSAVSAPMIENTDMTDAYVTICKKQLSLPTISIMRQLLK